MAEVTSTWKKKAYTEIPGNNHWEDKEEKNMWDKETQITLTWPHALRRADKTIRDNIKPSAKNLHDSPSMDKGK